MGTFVVEPHREEISSGTRPRSTEMRRRRAASDGGSHRVSPSPTRGRIGPVLYRDLITGAFSICTSTAIVVAAIIAAPAPAAAEEEAPGAAYESAVEVELETTIASAYVWRGQVLTTRPVVQPGAFISVHGLEIGAWANAESGRENGARGRFSEVDLSVGYAVGIPMRSGEEPVATFRATWMEYLFPTDEGDTAELIFAMETSVPTGPFFEFAYDFREISGVYFGVGLAPEVPLTDFATLTLLVSSGFADSRYTEFYFGEESGGAHDGNIRGGVVFEIGDWELDTQLGYTFLWRDVLRDAAREELYGAARFVGQLSVRWYP